MHHLAIKAVAAAMLVGAGTGAVTRIGGNNDSDIPRDVMNPMIDGQAMLTGATIYDNVSKSPEHTALLAALDRQGLAATLNGAGTYTVFAPTNAAYAALPRD
ncbi:MAG TPA: fasciclin domain-containing protein, partial [Rhizomicrobium sp.]